MLRDTHELDVRVAHVENVGDEPLGGFGPREKWRLAIPGMLPARQMHFIYVDRRAPPVALRALGHPAAVVPLVAFERGDDRCRLGPALHEKTEGIGLEQQ